MKKIWAGVLLLGACQTEQASWEGSGEISNAAVVCYGTTCSFQLRLEITDLDGQLIEENLLPGDFVFDEIEVSPIQADDVAPTVEDVEVRSLTQDIYGDHLCLTLLLDQSGSISETDPGDARISGARAIVSSVLSGSDDVDRIGLMAFPRVYGSLGDLEQTDIWQSHTNDAALLDEALERMSDAEGNETPIFDSIRETAMYFDTVPDCDGSKRVMVVLTDGEDNDSLAEASDALDALEDADVQLFVVAFSEEVDRAALQYLAQQTGGTYQDSDFNGLADVIAGLSDSFFSTVSLYGQMTLSAPLAPASWYTISGDVWYIDTLQIPFSEVFYVE